MLHLSRLTLLQMVHPIWVRIFFVLCDITMGLLIAKTRLPFLKPVLWLSFWKLWKFGLDRARFAIELADVCRLKLPTLGGAIDASPRLPSWLSRQRVEIGSGFFRESTALHPYTKENSVAFVRFSLLYDKPKSIHLICHPSRVDFLRWTSWEAFQWFC